MSSRLKNAATSLADTNLTAVYTVPTNFTAIVKEIFLTNVDGTSAVDATLKYTDTSGSATYALLSTKIIAADSYLRLENANIILEEGDILKAQAGAGNDLTDSIFVEEFFRPQG